MKFFLTLILSGFITLSGVMAQNDADFERKMKMMDEPHDSKGMEDIFFLNYKLSVLSEVLNVSEVSKLYSEYDNSKMVTIAGFTLEPRINVISNEKNALFIKAPIDLSFSYTKKVFHLRTPGFFNFTLPVLVGYARGLNASIANSQRHGIAISGGYQYIRAPLLGGNVHDDLSYGDEDYVPKKNWLMPLVMIDYYFVSRKGKFHGLSAAFCPNGNFYFKLALTFEGLKK